MGGFTFAQTIDLSGRILPYNVYLENNSSPAEGNYDLDVSVFTSSTGGSACDTLSFSNVQVSQGRFSVLLDVNDNCFSGTNLYLEMAVATAGETPVALASGAGGRVLVGSVPSAAQGSAFSRFFAEVLESVRLDADDVTVENSINFMGADQLGQQLTL
ncbi:MAG: hypothetical protein GY822_26065 [Deltaproteobacteria bacterium]|nr:hypothetical protein [Deltaproteobacteria bacterium]